MNALGQRYGLNPVTSQRNGWFIVDDRKGQFGFSSDLKEKLIIMEYISDGNAYDLDARIPKMAEGSFICTYNIFYIIYKRGCSRIYVQRGKRKKEKKC